MQKVRWSTTSAPKRARSWRSASAMPDRVADALAERAGGDLDAVGVAALGVAGRLRAPLPEVAQVVEAQVVAGEVEHRVQEDRRVPGREHEPIAVGPVRGAGVVAHDPRPEDVGERRQGHRGALVTRPRGVRRIHRQTADHVDGSLLEIGRGHSHPPYSRPIPVPSEA